MAGMTVQKEQERHDPKTIRFSALYEAAKILSDQIDLARGLHDVLRLLDACMGMTTSTVCLYDPQRCELTIEAAVGLTDEEQRRGRYRLGEGIVGKVMQSGLPIVVPDIGGQPHVLNRPALAIPRVLSSSVCPSRSMGRSWAYSAREGQLAIHAPQ